MERKNGNPKRHSLADNLEENIIKIRGTKWIRVNKWNVNFIKIYNYTLCVLVLFPVCMICRARVRSECVYLCVCVCVFCCFAFKTSNKLSYTVSTWLKIRIGPCISWITTIEFDWLKLLLCGNTTKYNLLLDVFSLSI